MDIKTLIAVATGKIPHDYRSGLCPDELQPDSRDPDCPACKVLIEAAAGHDEMERRLRESEARVTARIDEAVEAEREACAQVCDDATLTITEAAIIGDERRDAGINACTNLAKRIRARANQPTKGG